MNEQNNNGTREMPSVFENLLTESDVRRLDATLDKLPEDGFNASAVTGRTLAALGLSERKTVVKSMRARRPRLRMVLIAACAAVLLLATFVTAKTLRDRRAVDMRNLEEAPVELQDARIALGYSKQLDGHTITVVDMIADRYSMIFELSTDYTINAPDGWIHDSSMLPFELTYECTVSDPEDPYAYTSGYENGAAPFVRDGKLWYILSYHNSDLEASDISHLPVHLQFGPLTFEWTNNYEPQDRIITVNRSFDEFVLDEIDLTVSQITIRSHSTLLTYECRLDSIKLKDGTTLYYTCPTDSIPQNVSAQYLDDEGGKTENLYFNLMEGFSETPGGDPEFVAIVNIASVTVNGVEIPLE